MSYDQLVLVRKSCSACLRPLSGYFLSAKFGRGVAETQITNRREDRSHGKPGHLCKSTLTSSGFTRSGTVQPSMSYSAMH